MSEFQGFAFKSDDRKRLELLLFVFSETDCVTQADLPWAFGCQAWAPLLLAHF